MFLLNIFENYIFENNRMNKYRADIMPKWAMLEKIYNCEVCKKYNINLE